MSNTIRTFNSLPQSLQELAIQLAVTRARQDQHTNLRILVEEAVVAAGAALEVGVMPEVAVDPGKPGEDQTAYQQAEPAGPNSDYKDPKIFDPKSQDDAADALSYLFSALRDAAIPEKHCGRNDCEACNAMFGKPESEKSLAKLRFKLLERENGAFGPVTIYQSKEKPQVCAIVNQGKTAVIEVNDISLLTYQLAVEIVRAHGRKDVSIVG